LPSLTPTSFARIAMRWRELPIFGKCRAANFQRLETRNARARLPLAELRRNHVRMNSSFVLTVIGTDRPGLVGRLSSTIAEHGGNWLESRMAHLGGHFAGILRIEIAAARESSLLAALQSLDADGLEVRAHRDSAAARAGGGAPATVEIIGQDRPGI